MHERGELVVGDLAARVAEDELGDLARSGELLAVPLTLDQLGRPDHFVATKTELARRTLSGSSYGRGSIRVVGSSEATVSPDALVVVDRDPPVGVASLDAREVPKRAGRRRSHA